MRKAITRVLSLTLAIMLLSLSVTAFAEAAAAPRLVNNVIKQPGSGNTVGSSGRPSVADILATGDDKNIQLPKSSSYLSGYDIMYANAGKGNSIHAFIGPKVDSAKTRRQDVYHGTKVIVLAVENGMACAIYRAHTNDVFVGWLAMDELSWTYPGETRVIGRDASGGRASYLGDVEVSWSTGNFVGAGQKYTLLDTPVDRVSDFTLDYQVIGRNGAKTQEVLGPRSVYVNDGSGWVYVGQFDYDEIVPVRVIVYLDTPMTLAAVATVATCAQPDVFVFRQFVVDVCTR